MDISVIIPTYNRSASIERSIQSVLEQTYPVREIIVADDASSDDTETVIRKIKSDKIRYCRLEKNRGAGGARNYGAALAQGEVIAFHDSDDIWLPDKVEKQVAYWEANPQYGLIYSAYDMEVYPGYYHTVPALDGSMHLEGDILADLLVRNTCGAPTMMMKKDVFNEVGGFDEGMRSLEDWDLVIRIAMRYQIGIVPEVLVRVTKTPGSVSAANGNYFQNRCYMLQKYRTQYLNTGKLNAAVQDIMELAKRDNVLEQVEKLLLIYISGGSN